MGGTEAVLTAVQRIHEAPLSADGWTRALPSIAAATGSDRACLLIQSAKDRAVEFAAGFEFTPEHLADVAAATEAGRIPGWVQALPAGIPILSASAMSDREFLRSTFFNETLRPMGVFYGLALAPLSTGRSRVYLVSDRRLGRENYDSSHVASLQWLVPHIATALQVSQRLASVELHAASAYAALDQLETGFFLVDAEARILFANRIAETLLAGDDALFTEGGALGVRDPNAGPALRRAIAGCADPSSFVRPPRRVISIRREGECAGHRMIVSPLRPDAVESTMGLGPSRPVALVLIDADREQRSEANWLRRRFGLTAAEAEVALEIVKGDGRDAAAARLGITVATVRTHLIRIFEKTGVGRQAELVRLLLQGETDINAMSREPPRPGSQQ